ncbi:hypothetical protein L2E82_48062 [Cichorium intybus]|uniref:Uncharacterized protein n=1 Tax=Cichorium intybus TaxID=13427 RepID=A0ACB8YXS3_CICIN|nr:hypothetical protein L2E82_48062 [Cichorium intybus]
MRFHLYQSYAISSVSSYAILMEIRLRVKELMRFYDFSMARQPTQTFSSSTISTTNCSEVMEYHSESQPLRDATAILVCFYCFGDISDSTRNTISDSSLLVILVCFYCFGDSGMLLLLCVSSGDISDSTEKTNKKSTSDTYSRNRPNDDDNFINPPPVTLPIQKLVTKETRMANSKIVKDSLRKLNTSYFISTHEHDHIEEEEDETEHEEDDDVAAPERDCVSPVRDNKEVAHETSEKYEDYNVEYPYRIHASSYEIMREINFNFNAYHNIMRAIDTWLVRACPYFPNSDVSHDGTFFNGVATPVHGREITTESKDVEFHEAVIEDDAHNDVVFSTPFAQVLNEEAFDIIEKAALAALAPRRKKRHVQPTEKFRSPYFKRVVNPNKVLTSNEERVSGWIFAARTTNGEDLDKWDIGFKPEYEDSDDQQNQLDEMRKKYVTKILTWDLNVVEPFIYEMLASYDTLSDAEKESFNTEEHLLHIERIISLFC